MLDFDKFLARHGEVVAQAVLENLERYEGICGTGTVPLEQRWQKIVLQNNSAPLRRAA